VSTIQHAGQRAALDGIRRPDNVRTLDAAMSAHSPDPSSSEGCSSPRSCEAGDLFELVAGFHRVAAARSLGLVDVAVVVRDGSSGMAPRQTAVTAEPPRDPTAFAQGPCTARPCWQGR
jgi:ParB/Sulfiredoxin domain